ncbi:hypothetical protein LTR17_015619 [Elasticomyces elasticus]|nr:hypothetical protein LTR17_015619 [Elasticomyces elasticus]
MMGLPAELRLRILRYLLEQPKLDVYTRGRLGPPEGMKFPNIAYTTKTLRAQYLLVAIENTTFRVHNGPGNAHFQEWLASTDLSSVSRHHKTGFDAVKSLEFPYFSRFPHPALAPHVPNSDVSLMTMCKNLKELERYAPAASADEMLEILAEWLREGSTEYLALALEATTFTIHSGAGNDRFQDWQSGPDLSIFSSHYSNGYSAIKSLSFPYFSRFHHQLYPATTPNNDIELMDPLRQKRAAASRRVSYSLVGLQEMRGLKRVNLSTFGAGDIAMVVLKYLAAWLRGVLLTNAAGQGAEVVIT